MSPLKDETQTVRQTLQAASHQWTMLPAYGGSFQTTVYLFLIKKLIYANHRAVQQYVSIHPTNNFVHLWTVFTIFLKPKLFPTPPPQLSSTGWVSHDSTQFWHYPPGINVRSHRTVPTSEASCKSQVVTSTSDWPAINSGGSWMILTHGT